MRHSASSAGHEEVPARVEYASIVPQPLIKGDDRATEFGAALRRKGFGERFRRSVGG
jgi:hypothetical protein